MLGGGEVGKKASKGSLQGMRTDVEREKLQKKNEGRGWSYIGQTLLGGTKDDRDNMSKQK